jgi:hypothetical protein
LTRRTALKGLFGAGLAGFPQSPVSADLHGPSAHATSSGYARKRIPSEIKAIYLNPLATTDWPGFMRLVELIERTELNALVIDIKEDAVFYDTQVDFFRETRDVTPLYDLSDRIDELHKRGIYAIARQVVFKDWRVADARPDLAVKVIGTNTVWRDQNGIAWVNPFQHELWQANADLAREAAKLGFDEIQYDYVRFPSDGNLAIMDFGRPYTEQARSDAIVQFLIESRKRLNGTGGKLGADVFGYTLVVDNDNGIGQTVDRIARIVDTVCPMIYPALWPTGSLPVGGVPNDFPHDTIAISMDHAKAKLGANARKVRPWLQDFSLPGYRPYGAADVRAQIDAVEEAHVGGWMVWNPTNQYHQEAFTSKK